MCLYRGVYTRAQWLAFNVESYHVQNMNCTEHMTVITQPDDKTVDNIQNVTWFRVEYIWYNQSVISAKHFKFN